MNEAIDISKHMCPIDGAKCDRKCGFAFHATITRKKDIILPEDPADANICDGCE